MLRDTVITPDWPAPDNVRALCTTRNGGRSHRPFDSLNLAGHVGDEPRRVRENRQFIIDELELPAEPAWLDQQHGRIAVSIDRGVPDISADAAVSHRSDRVCAVLTADCLPVLLCDSDGTRVAAVHAGWRGIAAGVIEAAVEALLPTGRQLLAWLGPAISAACYEIDAPVRDRLLGGCTNPDAAFAATRPGHWNLDLSELARQRLQQVGVGQIFGGELCTYSDQRFYSHRRDGRCGRIASLIWLAD
ncbi:MAG: peptidoglycan editing factor PgeF [Gammaproteobacteria bacterium]|nr:peptidoglycan editing factor PgeF [Gammaproteobacteria bacterium]NNF62164.1 peptidoglycan editing factor PgeF [Gammaproteobacteria bacterium]NNM21855.1 peptidoglycan editing factor PgeF [Gammaproteobacteria bacterium]